MTNKYDDMPLGYLLDSIDDLDILADIAKTIGRMYENKESIDYIHVPLNGVQDVFYSIASLNHILVSFGYKASWDCMSYAASDGKHCVYLCLDKIDL